MTDRRESAIESCGQEESNQAGKRVALRDSLTCAVDGCKRPFYCKGWCEPHYNRWRRNGSPTAGNRTPTGRTASPVVTDMTAGPGERFCRKCGQVKPLSEFHKDRKRPDGVTFYCKVCNLAYDAAQRDRDPAQYAARGRQRSYKHRLRTHYGLTPEEYRAKIAAQGGVCAICGRPETARRRDGELKEMPVDHCHATGKVRDILCDACNGGLGRFDDDPARLRAAADYIERHRARITP